MAVADAIGLQLVVHRSDGTSPVGRGIGPALEAHDVLAVLRRDTSAPRDLRDRALDLAGALLDMANPADAPGRLQAAHLLDSGAAEAKFMAICAAQGGFREPEHAPQRHVVTATKEGRIEQIDNRQIAKIAKLAGAPRRKSAGMLLRSRRGQWVSAGDPLFEIHAESPGELAWALDFALSGAPALSIMEDA